MDVSARTTLKGAAKCDKHCELQVSCSSPGVTTLLFSLSTVVSGMCGSLFGSQLLQTPLTVSLMVLMSSLPLGEQHVSVFCLRYLMVPNLRVFSCNQVFVVLCRRTGRQRHLIPFVGVSSVRCVIVPCGGMRCGYGCSLWPQGVRTALLVSRLASNCSTERHSTAPQEANWLQWHWRVRATRASAKCLLRGRSLEASSPWHGSHVMPVGYSFGFGPRNPNWGCGACGMDGNWATRTVCKWSKNLMWLWCIWTEELGQFGRRVHLEFACVAVCSLLVRHHGSHA